MGAAAAAWTGHTVLVVFESFVMDRFLMARHRDRGWELPGGRIEPGEPLLDAGRREWAEECGLQLAHLEPLLLHERAGHGLGHVLLGASRPDSRGSPAGTAGANDAPPQVPPGEDKITELRWVWTIGDVGPLAFPDDPYEAVGRALAALAHRQGPWAMPPGMASREWEARWVGHMDPATRRTSRDHTVGPHPDAA